MPLYIGRVLLSEVRMPYGQDWDPARLPVSATSQVLAYEISSAPEGKHDLGLCAEYESVWRRNAPIIVDLLKGDDRSAFVWASGPLVSDGVLVVLRYVDEWNDSGARYHVEGLTSWDGIPGYCTGSVTFEFRKDTFERMMADESLDTEEVYLPMLLVPHKLTSHLRGRPLEAFGLRWLLDNDALALLPMVHFEGYVVLGSADTVTHAVRQISHLAGEQ